MVFFNVRFRGWGGDRGVVTKTLSPGMSDASKMTANKAPRASRATKVPEDPQYALAKAVQQMNQKQEAFLAGVEALRGLSTDMELRYASKRKQLEEVDEELLQKQKTRRFELELALKEEGYQRAVQILKDRGELALPTKDWTQLREEHEVLKRDKAKEVLAVVTSEREKWLLEKKQLEEMSKLRHDAENAKHVAELEQFKTHIKVLQEQIKDLKSDADKQRDLTRSLAEASRPQVVTQATRV